MTDEHIKYMVNRFLGWRLPENFNPDAGISFKKLFNEHLPSGPMKNEPTGTNLFDSVQAETMVRYLVDGMPEDRSNENELRQVCEAAAKELLHPYAGLCDTQHTRIAIADYIERHLTPVVNTLVGAAYSACAEYAEKALNQWVRPDNQTGLAIGEEIRSLTPEAAAKELEEMKLQARIEGQKAEHISGEWARLWIGENHLGGCPHGLNCKRCQELAALSSQPVG